MEGKSGDRSAGFRKAQELFRQAFGDPGSQMLLVHAPGRSEIAGNHTDHEGGPVIAGTLDVAADAAARPNGTDTIRLASEGYPAIEVGLDGLSPRAEERNATASLVRGMAAVMAEDGRAPQGFDIALTSTIPIGGGLSSSAAIEAALGRAMEALWPGRSYGALEMARLCQRVENEWFGKPCGLMDQAAVCLGGLASIDFNDPEMPAAERLSLDFEDMGCSLVLVRVGAGHEDLTSAYAAIPEEMHAVAQALGKTRLADVDRADFLAHLSGLRDRLGDRPCLRALHYWMEERLVHERWDALKGHDIDAFLAATRASGASSAMFLQNVTAGEAEQPAMVALALAESALAGTGACRIHGGGFGGTIQCFVPADQAGSFIESMDSWLGAGSARRYRISDKGAYAAWL